MKLTSPLTLALTVIGAIALLFLLNIATTFWNVENVNRIGKNHVRGMAVTHNKKLYTLNFDQQNEVLDILNQSINVGKFNEEIIRSFDFENIILYRFKEHDIVMIPKQIDDNGNLYFFIPEWNATGLVMDNSRGQLNKLISQTYDKN